MADLLSLPLCVFVCHCVTSHKPPLCGMHRLKIRNVSHGGRTTFCSLFMHKNNFSHITQHLQEWSDLLWGCLLSNWRASFVVQYSWYLMICKSIMHKFTTHFVSFHVTVYLKRLLYPCNIVSNDHVKKCERSRS